VCGVVRKVVWERTLIRRARQVSQPVLGFPVNGIANVNVRSGEDGLGWRMEDGLERGSTRY
jgi:hypothetical protein